jgi:hypothetical protein
VCIKNPHRIFFTSLTLLQTVTCLPESPDRNPSQQVRRINLGNALIQGPHFFLLTPQWFLTRTSDGWNIRSDRFSVDTPYHLAIGLYNASNLNPDPVDGLLIRARREPYLWHIWHDEVNPDTFR